MADLMPGQVTQTRLVSPGLLLSVAVCLELTAVAGGMVILSYASCVLFFSYFMLRPGTLELYSRLLGLATVVGMAALAAAGHLGLARLGEAAQAAAYYSSFLGSLGLMQSLVRRFELLHRVHDILLGGRSAFIYPKYAVTSFGIASVLNFSVVNVLCGSLAPTLEQRGITGPERQQWLRSILIVTLRGFALVPLVAPTSVAVAIITREVPGLSWGVLVPYTGFAALIFILVGWAIEARRFSAVSQQRHQLQQLPGGSLTLGACAVALMGGIAALVLLLGFSVSQAAMLSVPGLTVSYLVLRERRPVSLVRELQGNLTGLDNEMFIFACSGALGSTLAASVPDQFVAALAGNGSGEVVFAVASMLLIMVGAAIGVAPLVVLTFLAGVLGQLQVIGGSPLIVGVALAVGFSMAMLLSPFGPSVMVLARLGRISPYTVAFGWNLRFTVIALPVMILFLVLLASFAGGA